MSKFRVEISSEADVEGWRGVVSFKRCVDRFF